MSETATQTLRTCDWCGTIKAESDFYPDRRGAFRAECKRCTLDRMKQRETVGLEALQREQAKKNAAWVKAYLASRLAASEPDLTEKEVWLPVVGYESLYEVSDLGRVRSLWFLNGTISRPRRVPLILTHFINAKTKYHSVTLVKDGTHTTRNLHQLVLEAFVGPRPSERHIGGHRDGNGSNNRLGNLGWITYEENEADKRRHGRMMNGERNHQSKLTDDLVRQMRSVHAQDKPTCNQLGAMFGVCGAVAHGIVTGRAWRHVK